jgi:hypothetical protein
VTNVIYSGKEWKEHLTKAKYGYFGLLLACLILGYVVVTPASAAAPSWISDGKFADYYGGFNLQLGTQGQSGYIDVQFTVTSNWTLSSTALTQTTVSGGWNITIYIFFNSSVLFSGSFGTIGTEIVNLQTSNINTGGGFDFFGMEQVGQHTVLWVDNTTSLTASNVTIGGRHVGTTNSTFVLPVANLTIPITRFYDTQTGVLLGFDLALNATGLGSTLAPALQGTPAATELSHIDNIVRVEQGLSGLGSLGQIVFPVIVKSTNVVPYAWNPGGDLTIWLLAAGALIGLSALFAIVIYSKRR